MNTDRKAELLAHVAGITAAYVGNNTVAAGDVSGLIKQVWEAVSGLDAPAAAPAEVRREPAVSIKASVRHDRITCLHCGKQFKSMKRHVMASHNETADEYRRRWGLPHDYPLVAPDYAAARSALALDAGLGRRPAAPAPAPTAPPKRLAKASGKAKT